MKTLKQLSKKLALAGHEHVLVVVTAMAVRSYQYEGPILKDVQVIAQCIKRSLSDVPANYGTAGKRFGKQCFSAKISELGVPANIVKRYDDLVVAIEPGSTSALGLFFPGKNTIQLTYSPAMVDATTTNFKSMFRGLDVVIEHELRHFVDYCTGLHLADLLKPQDRKDGSFDQYYNTELELDARLTALYLKADTLFRGSAILALQGHVDKMSKQQHNQLKDFNAFWSWLIGFDVKLDSLAAMQHGLSRENWKEAEGKSKEFWKFLREEYGMAFKAIPVQEVTPAMKTAWLKLVEKSKHASTEDASTDSTTKKAITKIAGKK